MITRAQQVSDVGEAFVLFCWLEDAGFTSWYDFKTGILYYRGGVL